MKGDLIMLYNKELQIIILKNRIEKLHIYLPEPEDDSEENNSKVED